MRDSNDPPRLFETEEAPAELRAWLGHAHEDVPSSADAEQLIRAVEARAIPRPGQPASTPATRPSRRPRMGRHSTKLLAALALVGVGVGGWSLATRHGSPVAESPAVAPRLGDQHQGTDIGQPASPPQETAVAPAALSPEDQATPPATAKSPRLVRGRARERETVHRVSVQAQPSSPRADDAGADEFRLLRSARQAVGDRPERALALTDEHARRFPSGMLGQERETIAIEALAKLGREAQAKARARGFLATHPDSPYRSRIEAAIAPPSGERKTP